MIGGLEITPLLPPDDSAIDFDMLDCTAVGSEISIAEDGELSVGDPVPVVDLGSMSSQVTFYPECSRPYVVIHFKNIDKFLSIRFLCVDDTDNNNMKELIMSNKFSFVTVDETSVKMPLEMESGWQHVCIELDELLANAYGSTYVLCKELTITGGCRFSKIYFQSKMYSDVELPNFLRVVNAE